MRAFAALRCRSQAAISDLSCCWVAMRRSRHWLRSTPISISTMLSQLACLGTKWNSSRRSTRRRAFWMGSLGVEVEHVLHPGDVFAIHLRNAPHVLAPRLEVVFGQPAAHRL